MLSTAEEGIVVETHGRQSLVHADGRVVLCRPRGRLLKGERTQTALLVVGDRVRLVLTDDHRGVIEEILPRRSQLARRASGRRPDQHVLAANVDLAVVVLAAAQPGFRASVLDRFAALLGQSGVGGLLCLNKADLDRDGEVARAALAAARPLGIPILATSAATGEGVPALQQALSERIAVLIGPSGTGKSSLIRALVPGGQPAARSVNPVTGKGRHTTASSRLYPLPGGGFLVDTPGIREVAFLSPQRLPATDLLAEITALAAACRYRDCTHTHEPRCAVKAAVEDGRLDGDLYRRWLRLR